jgi:hypothetical protein
MTTRYQLPPPEALGFTRQLFDAIINLQGLKPGGEDSKAKKITISRLYAYATGVDSEADPELERLLGEDLKTRRDFRRLLQKTTKWHMPQVAAASTGAINQRVGVNCRIRFESSRAEPDQTYVIIETTDNDMPAPVALFVCDASERTRSAFRRLPWADDKSAGRQRGIRCFCQAALWRYRARIRPSGAWGLSLGCGRVH